MDRRSPAAGADLQVEGGGDRSSTSGPSSSRPIPTSAKRWCAWACTIPPSGKRLVLNAPEASRREYIVAKLQILASNENIFVMSEGRLASGGKRRQERAERVAVVQEDRARCRSRTRRRTSTLYLEYDARPDLFTPPQQVTLKIGDQEVGRFTADAKIGDDPDVSADRRATRDRRHGGPGPRRRSDVQAWRHRSARAGHPGLPRLRRTEVGAASERPAASDHRTSLSEV